MTRARSRLAALALGVVALGCGRSLGGLDSTPDCDAGECASACEAGGCAQQECVPGAACALADPCSVGVTDCVGGSPACVHAGRAPDGTLCGNGDTCFAGSCGSCANAGQACTLPGNLCATGTRFCNGSGTSVCTATGNVADGTACGGNRVCVRGGCVDCTSGGSCSNSADPCHAGVMACSTSGAATCLSGGPAAANGTSCGDGGVCNAGSCVACAGGTSCDVGIACQSGFITCGTGSPVCSAGGPIAADGTPCGADSGVDSVCFQGRCLPCTPGAACSPFGGDGCATGTVVCTGGTPSCLPSGSAADGTPCGAGQVCESGFCTSRLSLTPAAGPFDVNRTWNGLLATISDAVPTDAAGDLRVTVDWGDGTNDPVAVTGSNGSFSLSGTHTYAAGVVGVVPVQIDVTDAQGDLAVLDLSMVVGITEVVLNEQVQSICAGPDGNLWFTLPNSGRIGRITTGGQVAEFLLPAGALPMGIAAGPDGNVWFADTGTSSIGRVTPAEVIDEFPLPAANPGLSAITSGPDGNLWFTESELGALGRITPTNPPVVTEFPLPNFGAVPVGIAAGPDGNVWFADESAGAIGRLVPGGAAAGQVTDFTGALSLPVAIVAGPDGNLWFGQLETGNLGQITPAGTMTFVPTDLFGIAAIGVGPGGDLWIADTNPGAARVTISTRAAKDVQFPFAVFGFAAGPDGDLWIAEGEGVAHTTP